MTRNPVWRWFDNTFLDLGRQFRWSYLPPLMIYLAAGVQGLTAIVGTFFIKEYLDLSAAFLAGPDLAPQGAAGLHRCLPDYRKHPDHVRHHRAYPGHG
jgi:hypothetical protein